MDRIPVCDTGAWLTSDATLTGSGWWMLPSRGKLLWMGRWRMYELKLKHLLLRTTKRLWPTLTASRLLPPVARSPRYRPTWDIDEDTVSCTRMESAAVGGNINNGQMSTDRLTTRHCVAQRIKFVLNHRAGSQSQRFTGDAYLQSRSYR